MPIFKKCNRTEFHIIKTIRRKQGQQKQCIWKQLCNISLQKYAFHFFFFAAKYAFHVYSLLSLNYSHIDTKPKKQKQNEAKLEL